MPSNPYPVLGPEGYIYDPSQKIEAIFADYIASKNSQSTLFHGQVQSLSFDEYKGQYEAILSGEVIKQSLEALFEAYFDNVDINVTDNSEENDTVVTKITIVGELVDKGSRYRLNEVLSANNGKIKRLAQFN